MRTSDLTVVCKLRGAVGGLRSVCLHPFFAAKEGGNRRKGEWRPTIFGAMKEAREGTLRETKSAEDEDQEKEEESEGKFALKKILFALIRKLLPTFSFF